MASCISSLITSCIHFPEADHQLALTPAQLSNFPHGFEAEISIIRDLCNDDDIKFGSIDYDSLRNMSLGLRFADISTLSEARELDLQIIPPAPIFHIWVALRGASFFNGSNNPKGLDYVSRITQQADFLLEYDTPLFLVYTEKGMTDEQKQEMESLFTTHSNIMVLSVEKHLSHLPMAYSYSGKSSYEKDHMGTYDIDGLRVSVLMDFPEVFEVLEQEAVKQDKLDFVERLKRFNGQSATYHDIDDQFIKRPPFFLAKGGIMCGSLFDDRELISFRQQVNKDRKYDVATPIATYQPRDETILTGFQLESFQQQRTQLLLDLFNTQFEVNRLTFMSYRNFYSMNHNAVMRIRTKLQAGDNPKLRSSQHDYLTFDSHAFSPCSRSELVTKFRKLEYIQQVNYTYFGHNNSWN
ncbi:hypothetical protein [Parashewanella curva]|uniref:hypothetical protein n=1 Tax=Parashewanella curva TaxID=2338552 RepID=UPI00105A2DBA|nr:hypothetical protein [Parashewanella curva]